MPRSTRRNRHRDDYTVFMIRLSGPELLRWHALAQKLELTFEELVKESVELAWVRGSTR